jgi:hypothetical protein
MELQTTLVYLIFNSHREPKLMTKTPLDINIFDCETWDKVPASEYPKIIAWQEEFLTKLLAKEQEPQAIANLLLNQAIQNTSEIRTFYEINPTKKPPHESEMPGKMDHAGVAVIKIPESKSQPNAK